MAVPAPLATSQLWTCGTPKWGMYLDRHKRILEDAKAAIHAFSSFDNPFIPHEVFALAKAHMDEKTYRQEILAEWVYREDIPLVLWSFDREKHCVTLPFDIGRDITKEVTRKRCGVSRSYICGVDYNWDYPNFAVLHKVYAPNIWVTVDVV